MEKKTNKFDIKKFREHFQTKRATFILSLFLAFCAWVVVVTVISPQSTGELSIPVTFDYNEAVYTTQGLSIVEKPSYNVTVKLSGDGSVLGSLSQSDILVYPDYSTVKGAGTYTLKLIVRNAGTKRFEITNKDNFYVDLTFDKVVTNKFPLVVNVTGVEPMEGYFMDIPVASPAEITLTGPEKSMNKVEKVVVNVAMTEQRTESAIVTARPSYLDANGDFINDDDITADIDQVEVTIPIYRIKELPLTLEYTSVPSGYDPSLLGATLSDTTIRVAGPAAQLDNLTSISAGIIDLSSFVLGEDIVTNITLPENIRNVDGLQNVTVSFNTQNYKTKTITVTELRTINVPEGVSITFPNARVNNVTLIGDADELDALADTGVVGQVDVSPSNLSVSRGQQNIAVQIVVPSGHTIFATGSYTILCNVETTATSSSSTQGAQ